MPVAQADVEGVRIEPIAKKIEDLRRSVTALDEEFDIAQRLYEAWLPMSGDRSLHARVDDSGTGGTFAIIRYAVRRETISALLRIWDRSSKRNLRMSDIAKTLRQDKVVNELARRRADQHNGAWVDNLDTFTSLPDTERLAAREAMKANERAFGLRQALALRDNTSTVIQLVESYEGGANALRLSWLRAFRNQRLAHRQVVPNHVLPEPAEAESDIEKLYLDTMKAMQLLIDIALDVGFDPLNTERIRRKDAVEFWAGVHRLEI